MFDRLRFLGQQPRLMTNDDDHSPMLEAREPNDELGSLENVGTQTTASRLARHSMVEENCHDGDNASRTPTHFQSVKTLIISDPKAVSYTRNGWFSLFTLNVDRVPP